MVTSNGNAVPTIELEDGKAEYMGDGVFTVLQRDATTRDGKMQSVVLTRQDLEAMLATA